MKKRIFVSVVIMLLGIVFLTGCDPIYPLGNIQAEKIGPLSQGESAQIKLVYPNTGGSIVTGWKDQKAEIIEGEDIVEISGLNVTGLKPGTAKIKISATTVIIEEYAAEGKKEKVYSTEITVKVE